MKLVDETERRGMPLKNTPRLLLFTNSESSPIDGGLSDVEDRHGALAGWLADPDGLLESPADPDTYSVDRLEDLDDLLACPGDRLLTPDDRLGDLDGCDGNFAGPLGVVLCWPQRFHHAAIVAGHDEAPPRLVAYPDDRLEYLGCLDEDRGGLLDGPADPGGYPARLVACLDDLGLALRPRSSSGHRWDRCTRLPPASLPRELSVTISSCSFLLLNSGLPASPTSVANALFPAAVDRRINCFSIPALPDTGFNGKSRSSLFYKDTDEALSHGSPWAYASWRKRKEKHEIWRFKTLGRGSHTSWEGIPVSAGGDILNFGGVPPALQPVMVHRLPLMALNFL